MLVSITVWTNLDHSSTFEFSCSLFISSHAQESWDATFYFAGNLVYRLFFQLSCFYFRCNTERVWSLHADLNRKKKHCSLCPPTIATHNPCSMYELSNVPITSSGMWSPPPFFYLNLEPFLVQMSEASFFMHCFDMDKMSPRPPRRHWPACLLKLHLGGGQLLGSSIGPAFLFGHDSKPCVHIVWYKIQL